MPVWMSIKSLSYDFLKKIPVDDFTEAMQAVYDKLWLYNFSEFVSSTRCSDFFSDSITNAVFVCSHTRLMFLMS